MRWRALLSAGNTSAAEIEVKIIKSVPDWFRKNNIQMSQRGERYLKESRERRRRCESPRPTMKEKFKLFGPKPAPKLAPQRPPLPEGFPRGAELMTRDGLKKLQKIVQEKSRKDIDDR